jgi:hypothetical protein
MTLLSEEFQRQSVTSLKSLVSDQVWGTVGPMSHGQSSHSFICSLGVLKFMGHDVRLVIIALNGRQIFSSLK